MEVKYGNGKIDGPGVDIYLTADELATAIAAFTVAHGIHIYGPRTIKVNEAVCVCASIHVDPSGGVINDEGIRISGRGP